MSHSDDRKKVYKVFENGKQRQRKKHKDYQIYPVDKNLYNDLNEKTSATSLEQSQPNKKSMRSNRESKFVINRNISPPNKHRDRHRDSKDDEIELLIQILELALKQNKNIKPKVDKMNNKYDDLEDGKSMLDSILKLYTKSKRSSSKATKSKHKPASRIETEGEELLFSNKTDSSEASNNRSLSDRINRILYAKQPDLEGNSRKSTKIKTEFEDKSLSVMKDLVSKLSEVAEKICGNRVRGDEGSGTKDVQAMGDGSEEERLTQLLNECMARNLDTQRMLEELQKQIQQRKAVPSASSMSKQVLCHHHHPHFHAYQTQPVFPNNDLRPPWWYGVQQTGVPVPPPASRVEGTPSQRRCSSQDSASRGCRHHHRHRHNKEWSEAEDRKRNERLKENAGTDEKWEECNKTGGLVEKMLSGAAP